MYQWTCLKCKEINIEAHYIGETSRTTYERFLDHKKLIEKEDAESPMTGHFQKHHQGVKTGLEHFKLEVVQRFAKGLGRL